MKHIGLKVLLACLLAGTLILASFDNEPISSDRAYDYVLKLEDYVEKTGDSRILDHFLDDMDYIDILEHIDYIDVLERMDRELLLEFVEDYLAEAYSDGWSDCEEEIDKMQDEYFWDGYYYGTVAGYDDGYADGSNGRPFNEEMVDRLLDGYFGD